MLELIKKKKNIIITLVICLFTGTILVNYIHKKEVNKVSPEAKLALKSAYDFNKKILNELNIDWQNPKIAEEYGLNGSEPFGMGILENNKDKPKDGVLMCMRPVVSYYSEVIGLDYEVWFMTNKEQAKIKYNALKDYAEAEKEYEQEENCDGTLVYMYIHTYDVLMRIEFVICKNTVVYYTHDIISENSYGKMQNFFDLLNIKYKVPTIKDITNKVNNISS